MSHLLTICTRVRTILVLGIGQYSSVFGSIRYRYLAIFSLAVIVIPNTNTAQTS